MIDELAPLLDEGDIVIDGGNSHFRDTSAGARGAAREQGLRFVGTGVSGGEEGALQRPEHHARRRRARPTTTVERRSSPRSPRRSTATPCCTYIGPDGAGHYVKMVHNGIEYGDMQLIAEAYDLLRHGVGLSRSPSSPSVFDDWNKGELESFLIEITAHGARPRPTPRPASRWST